MTYTVPSRSSLQPLPEMAPRDRLPDMGQRLGGLPDMNQEGGLFGEYYPYTGTLTSSVASATRLSSPSNSSSTVFGVRSGTANKG